MYTVYIAKNECMIFLVTRHHAVVMHGMHEPISNMPARQMSYHAIAFSAVLVNQTKPVPAWHHQHDHH